MHDPGQGLLLSTSRLRTRHRDSLVKAGLLPFDFRVGAEIAICAQANGDKPSSGTLEIPRCCSEGV